MGAWHLVYDLPYSLHLGKPHLWIGINAASPNDLIWDVMIRQSLQCNPVLELLLVDNPRSLLLRAQNLGPIVSKTCALCLSKSITYTYL